MFLLSVLLPSGIYGQTSVCDGQYFCAIYDGSKCMTIHSSTSGWAAFGTGSEMAGSDMYFVSNDQAANLAGSGHDQPNFKANLATSAQLSPSPSWAKLSKSFCMSDTQVSSLKSGNSFIYALSRRTPSGTGSSLQFSQHDTYSTLSADFKVAGNTTSSAAGPILKTGNMESIILIHGIVLLLAWLVAPVVGIFTARYLKDALGKYWYYVHAGLLGIVTVGGTWFGIILMILYRNPNPGHFSAGTDLGNSHVKLGLLVGLVVIAQGTLGVLINKWYNPNRITTPLSDKIHWWLGRVAVIIGILNVFLGAYYYNYLYDSNSGKIIASAGYVIVTAAVLSFAGGEYFIGQKHHNGGSWNSEQDVMLSQ